MSLKHNLHNLNVWSENQILKQSSETTVQSQISSQVTCFKQLKFLILKGRNADNKTFTRFF